MEEAVRCGVVVRLDYTDRHGPALLEAARERVRAAVRVEAEQLATDEQDRAVAAQVLRDMAALRAW